jgi:hypothetical protein
MNAACRHAELLATSVCRLPRVRWHTAYAYPFDKAPMIGPRSALAASRSGRPPKWPLRQLLARPLLWPMTLRWRRLRTARYVGGARTRSHARRWPGARSRRASRATQARIRIAWQAEAGSPSRSPIRVGPSRFFTAGPCWTSSRPSVV